MDAPKPLRVLRIITRMNVGGPSRQVSLLSGIPGYETLTVFGQCESGEKEDAHLITELKGNWKRIHSLKRSIRPWSDLSTLLSLIRIILLFKPDIVHTHTAKAGMIGRLAAWLCRIPIIIHTYHGHVLEGYFSPQVSSIFRFIERWLAKRSNALILLSNLQWFSITEKHQIGNPQKNRIIPLGLRIESWIENNAFPKPIWYQERQLNPNIRYISWVGRLTAIKNPLLLIEIALELQQFKDLPDWKILVAGDGELRPELEAAIEYRQLGSAIQLLSWEEDLFSLCRASEIALLTSRQEGTPVSLIEAMACGVPVVATSVGGIPDIIPKSAGLLTEPGDARALAQQVRYLLLNPEKRAQLGAAGRNEARKFTASRLIQDIQNLYEEFFLSGAAPDKKP